MSHAQALERMRQAGATPVTAIQFGSELMRNWARSISNSFRKVLQWYFPRRFCLMKEGKIGQSGIRCADDRGLPVARKGPFHGLGQLGAGLRVAATDPQVQGLPGLTSGLVAIGTVFYHWAEGWSYLDACYFSVITLATVGYGDLSPKTDLGKLFTIGFILIGVGLFVALASAVAGGIIEARRGERSE